MNETELQNRIRLSIGAIAGVRMFRNQVGNFRSLDSKRIIKVGTVGSSDLIGFTSKTITPDMVGQVIAQYVALEIKTPTGKVSPQQSAFIDMVNKSGGIGAIVRSVDDAKQVFASQ